MANFLPGLDGPMPQESVLVTHGADEYVLDVRALTSNYECIYGRGCRGTSPLQGEGPGRHRPADPAVGGCCRTAPRYSRATAEVGDADPGDVDSPLRVAGFAKALGPDEAQHYAAIAAGEWFTETEEDGRWTAQNTAVGGNCIFLNTETPADRLGCALFHLAERLGVDPAATRPMVCSVEPAAALVLADDLPGGGLRILVTLRPHWSGWFARDGWFCTTDPAAYSAAEPVFRSMAGNYATLLGDDVYAALLPTLEQAWTERGERLRRSWGQPVALTTPSWAR